MENPFLLAIALWESRKTMIRFFPRRTYHQVESPPGVEKPIDWQLLADNKAESEAAQERASNPAHAPWTRDKTVERCLACEAVVSKEKESGPALPLSALCAVSSVVSSVQEPACQRILHDRQLRSPRPRKRGTLHDAASAKSKEQGA